MRPLKELLREAAGLHKHICPGQVLGVRMAVLGCRMVGIDEPASSKSLLAYVEIDRCVADAVQAVTGCKLGKRTLKYLDYGKVAASFLNLSTGDAVRVVARDDSRDAAARYAGDGSDKRQAQVEAYQVMPESELFTAMPVTIIVSDFEMPGRPLRRVACDACGEGVLDGREVVQSGWRLCKPCAHGAYYQSTGRALQEVR